MTPDENFRTIVIAKDEAKMVDYIREGMLARPEWSIHDVQKRLIGVAQGPSISVMLNALAGQPLPESYSDEGGVERLTSEIEFVLSIAEHLPELLGETKEAVAA